MVSKENLPKLAEIQISYEKNRDPESEIIISSSKDSEFIFRHFYDTKKIEYREEFKVMYLDRSNKLLGVVQHTQGGMAGTVVDIAQVIGVACTCNASGIILVHNHPSGNLKPSEQDLLLTKNIKSSCTVMKISLLDHLILSKDSYYSFADEGVL